MALRYPQGMEGLVVEWVGHPADGGWRLVTDPETIQPDVAVAAGREMTGWDGRRSGIYQDRVGLQADMDRIQSWVLHRRERQ